MDDLLRVFGVVLILEGLLPLLVPARWREAFQRLLQLRDGQLRFIGALSLAAGSLLLLLAAG